MDSVDDTRTKRVGCPIRKSSDQSLLAAPRGLSQRATSFIASWRQGIHQMPLLSSAHPSDNRTLDRNAAHHPAVVGNERFQQQLALQTTLPTPERRQGLSIPMPFLTRAPSDGRPERREGTRIACQHPSTHDAREALREAFVPADGLHHHHTMSKEQSPTTYPPGCIRSDAAGMAQGRGFPSRRPGRTPRPRRAGRHRCRRAWWAWADLNGRPHAYQACALTS